MRDVGVRRILGFNPTADMGRCWRNLHSAPRLMLMGCEKQPKVVLAISGASAMSEVMPLLVIWAYTAIAATALAATVWAVRTRRPRSPNGGLTNSKARTARS